MIGLVFHMYVETDETWLACVAPRIHGLSVHRLARSRAIFKSVHTPVHFAISAKFSLKELLM